MRRAAAFSAVISSPGTESTEARGKRDALRGNRVVFRGENERNQKREMDEREDLAKVGRRVRRQSAKQSEKREMVKMKDREVVQIA